MDAIDRSVTGDLSHTLGEAVGRIWSSIPQDVQHRLFEAAVLHQGESVRSQLAVHLHNKHARTWAAMRARAILEPDSLGG
jgi:hypothetical protein